MNQRRTTIFNRERARKLRVAQRFLVMVTDVELVEDGDGVHLERTVTTKGVSIRHRSPVYQSSDQALAFFRFGLVAWRMEPQEGRS